MDLFTINVNVVVTNEDIENIIVTAIEGGIGYWACLINEGKDWDDKPHNISTSVHVANLLMKRKGVWFYDTDEGMNKESMWELTIDKFLSGLKMWVAKNKRVDFDNVDANDADHILQYALFNDIIYG